MKNIKVYINAKRLCLLFLLILLAGTVSYAKKPKVLIFSKTAGFKHGSIPKGIIAIQKLGAENKFDVDTTTDVKNFNPDFLKKYKAVIFLSPTGSVFNNKQKDAFQKYIQKGGGFVGIHSATDFEYNWPWYGRLVGAYFSGHPHQQVATIRVLNAQHISTKHLPNPWVRKDEWYNFRSVSKDIQVLLELDESTYDVGKNKMGSSHPIAWYHDFEGGRSFYTGLGHTDESYEEPLFLQHLLGGILYASKISKR